MCSTSRALIGAFAAVESDAFIAAVGSVAYLGLAGEHVAEQATGPGSFAVALLDALDQLDWSQLVAEAKLAPAVFGTGTYRAVL